MIPIAKPIIGSKEIKAVTAVLKSGSVAQGKWVRDFEDRFASLHSVKYAVATSSGTTALHLALLALGIGKGDEVITTPFTFIASANAILYVGAKPVFVDIDEETFNINPKLIEKKITSKTKAILPVHLYGLPANMHEIMSIARRHNLFVIEDACQAHGAEIKGRKVGTIGDVGCFSFYPTKNMTTGEGGMVTTNDKELVERLVLFREHGMKVRYHHDVLGFNFRMTNIEAAIGIEQLKKLTKFNKVRIKNARFLNKHLSKVKGLILPLSSRGYKHVFHQYTIRITKDYFLNREDLIKRLLTNNIGSSIYYPIPVHKQKIYLDLGYKNNFPIAEKLSQEVLSLPVHPSLRSSDLNRIVKVLKRMD